MKELENEYKWLRVVRVDVAPKFNKAKALNLGIDAVKTEFTCLTDIDQIFQPNFFNILSNASNKNVFVKCKTYFAKKPPSFPPHQINNMKYHMYLNWVKKNPQREPHGEGCCQCFSTDKLRQIGGHDERYDGWGYEDKDLELRARALGLSIVWVDTLTSMIHLPHDRNKNYFNHALIRKNKQLFESKGI